MVQKERKVKMLRAQIDREHGYTFQPKITEHYSHDSRSDLISTMKAQELKRQEKLYALQEAVLAREA